MLQVVTSTSAAARLQAIARLGEGESPADPALAEALAAIVLRARIELARRGPERSMPPV